MALLLLFLQTALFLCAFCSIAYYLFALVAAECFFRQRVHSPSPVRQPVSILIPLCGADREAYENCASFCRQTYVPFQLLFGVREAQDPAVAVVRQIQQDFPNLDIELVIDPHSIGHNLKVGNLYNLLQKSKYEQIIFVDSDVRVGSDYLDRILSELQEENVGLVTCLYRIHQAPHLASVLEAIGISSDFLVGVLTARLLEGMKFGLGATLATTKSILNSIGGMQTIANHLGDDFLLGRQIAAAGKEVRLSHYLVETSTDADHLGGMLRHQIRWARGTRACRPGGYLGLILTYGTATSLGNAMLAGFSKASLVLFFGVLLVRGLVAWRIGVHWIQDRILKRFFWLVPLRDLLSFYIWLMSLGGRQVEWRGIRYTLAEDGRITVIGKVDASR